MLCRIKQEDILQSAEASRDTLQTRLREQEVSMEQSLDALENQLQVIQNLINLLLTILKDFMCSRMQIEAWPFMEVYTLQWGATASSYHVRQYGQGCVRPSKFLSTARVESEKEGRLQEYNTMADRLQLIPRTAKRAGGMQFEAKLNRSGGSPFEITNVDLKV